MVRIQEAAPSARLRDIVRLYVQRDILRAGAPLLRPLPARCSPILEFHLDGDVSLRFPDGREAHAAVPVIVGPQTFRGISLIVRAVQVFTIFFHPSGPYRLFGLPLSELNENGEQARAVLGPSIPRLEEQLRQCRSFAERVRVANGFLLQRLDASCSADAVSAAAIELYRNKGRISISALAAGAGLSLRQFERRFVHQVGMRPKLYARIARFEGALEERARAPHKSWAALAQDLGYHDQMHLVHDFRQLSGVPPSRIGSQEGVCDTLGLVSASPFAV